MEGISCNTLLFTSLLYIFRVRSLVSTLLMCNVYDDWQVYYCSVLSKLCTMTSIFPKIQCSIHQLSDMKYVKRYLISAALILCLLYNVIFTPSNTKLQRTINIVTDKVKSAVYCDKYLVPFISNGKYAKTSQPELIIFLVTSFSNILREGSLWGPVCISRHRLWRLGGGGGHQGAGSHDSPPWSCVSG